MFDFSDFLGGMLEVGSSGRRWRSWWAIGGLILGAGVGGWIGYESSGVPGALGGLATGGFLGWILSLLLNGFLRFIVLFLILFAVVMGFQWMTGGL